MWPQAGPGATIEEIMTVEEATVVQDWKDAKALVEVECAEHADWQDLDERATDTIISFPLFLKHLKAMGKWDPNVNTEKDVRQMMHRTPPRKMEWGGRCFVVHGPYCSKQCCKCSLSAPGSSFFHLTIGWASSLPLCYITHHQGVDTDDNF